MARIYAVTTEDDRTGRAVAVEYFDEEGRAVPAERVPVRVGGALVRQRDHVGATVTSRAPARHRPGPRSPLQVPEPSAETAPEAAVLARLLRTGMLFLPADPARAGLLAFRAEGRVTLPGGLPVRELTVVVPHGAGVRRRTVKTVVLPLRAVLPALLATTDSGALSRSASAWRAAAVFALGMAARGRLLPGVSPAGHDAWRTGPWEAQDAAWVRELAEVMPPEAYAVALPGEGPPLVPAPAASVRAFVDAVADLLPRTPAAPTAVGSSVFTGPEPVRVPELGGWSDQVAEGRDRGVRVSLRVDIEEPDDQALAAEGPNDGSASGLAVTIQLHPLAEPGTVVDAGEVWRFGSHLRYLPDRPGTAGRSPADRAPGSGNGARGSGPAGSDSREAAWFGPRERESVLRTIRSAVPGWLPLGRLLPDAVGAGLPLSGEEFTALLHGAAERLADYGLPVHWPRDLVEDLTTRAVVSSERPAQDTTGRPTLFSSDQLFSFRWELAVGDSPLTASEMEHLVRARRPVVRLRDQWVVLDATALRRAREGERALGALEGLTAALAGVVPDPAGPSGEPVLVPLRAEGALSDLRERLSAPERADADELRPPARLNATLRHYQQRGLAWLDRMTRLGLGVCLADDMGLGKTVTLIALHLRRRERNPSAGPTLVVCPASLLGNWAREIEKFAPGTPYRRYHGPDRRLDALSGDEFVLTTYGTARRDATLLADAGPWDLVSADEAQHLKNHTSVTAKALRTIPSSARIALTGTPVENNLSELWALLDWATPGLLGSHPDFRRRHGRSAESAALLPKGDGPVPAGSPDPAALLGRIVRPFLLRRRKSDPGIAPELPPKTETDQRVTLTREQAALYEAQVRESMAAISSARGIARRGLVLKLLTALKQICNHPAHYLKEQAGAPLTGRSGKLALLDEVLDSVLAEGQSVLVFTQYVQMGRILERHLAARRVPTLFLHGQTPVARREEMVERFQSGEAPVFLLSLKAAGTGLNLTRAGHVVHYDRWWNPAVEDQATDRAYRIGQTQPVQVHRMISEGTLEDRIAALLRSKRGLAEAVLGGGESALSELSDEELTALVSLQHAVPRAGALVPGRSMEDPR